MCKSGVNHNQLKTMLEMSAEQTALTGSWLKEIAHLAGHAGLSAVEDIDKAARLLKEARRALEDAIEAAEAEGENGQVEVRVV